MRGLLAVALLAAPWASSARAETVVVVTPPLRLEGPTPHMSGPEGSDAVRFPHSGYIVAHQAEVLDRTGAPRPANGLHCHSIFYREGPGDRVPVPGYAKDESFLSEPVRLATSDNQGSIRFPDGFGLYVDSAQVYGVSGMLTDPEGAHAGEYRLRYSFELAPADPPLKRLRGMVVKFRAPRMKGGQECGHSNSWDVPPGRHEYVKEFVMPTTARVHAMSAHAHAYARSLELLDGGGKTLWSKRLTLAPDGRPVDEPLYSDADGLLLRKGVRYRFRMVYDNPLDHGVDAMGNLRLFVRDEPLVYERTLGFTLKGKALAMAGPTASAEQRFPGRSFITAFSARIKDEAARSRDHDGLHCHSSLDDGQTVTAAAQRYSALGLRAETARLVLNEGLGEIRFPEGFGMPVEPKKPYSLQGMLEDDDGSRSGRYTVDYRIELAPAEAPLTPLTGLLVLIRGATPPSGHEHCDSSVWSVPPGRHAYEKPFTMPYAGRVHLIAAHVHRYVRELEIVDLDSGLSAYRAPVALNAAGYADAVPVYSSASGIPLRKDGRYLFRVTYDNPTQGDTPGAGALRLYVREDPS